VNYIKLRNKINENVSQSKSILKKNNIPESDKKYLELRKLLKGKEGYLGWFTEMAFVNKVYLDEIENLIQIIEQSPEIIKGLPNKLINYDKWEDVLDDVIRTRENIFAKRIWNEFPSTQKKLLPFKGISRDDISMLAQLYNNEERKNIIKKISRYKTKEKLVGAIKRFLSGSTSDDFISIG